MILLSLPARFRAGPVLRAHRWRRLSLPPKKHSATPAALPTALPTRREPTAEEANAACNRRCPNPLLPTWAIVTSLPNTRRELTAHSNLTRNQDRVGSAIIRRPRRPRNPVRGLEYLGAAHRSSRRVSVGCAGAFKQRNRACIRIIEASRRCTRCSRHGRLLR